MGLTSLVVFSLFLIFNFLSMAVAQKGSDRSAISFTLCDGFTGELVNFRINVRAKTKQGSKGIKLSTKITGTTRKKFFKGKIKQKDVKHVRVITDQEICFQALVFDTTIIISSTHQL